MALTGYFAFMAGVEVNDFDDPIDDWDESLFQMDSEEVLPNPSINIDRYAARTNAVYLEALIITQARPFPESTDNTMSIFMDVDDNSNSGFWLPGFHGFRIST